MTDATTPTAAAAPTPADTLLTKVESDLALLGSKIVAGVEIAVEDFDEDVLPYVKAFIVSLFQQETKDAMKAAVAALPLALSGNPEAAAAAVGAAVAGSLAANAAADAETEVQAAVAAEEAEKSAPSTDPAAAPTGEASTSTAAADAAGTGGAPAEGQAG